MNQIGEMDQDMDMDNMDKDIQKEKAETIMGGIHIQRRPMRIMDRKRIMRRRNAPIQEQRKQKNHKASKPEKETGMQV